RRPSAETRDRLRAPQELPLTRQAWMARPSSPRAIDRKCPYLVVLLDRPCSSRHRVPPSPWPQMRDRDSKTDPAAGTQPAWPWARLSTSECGTPPSDCAGSTLGSPALHSPEPVSYNYWWSAR